MFEGIDPIAVAMLGFAVVGAVEFVKRLFDRDYRTAVIIAVAAGVGAVLAEFALPNVGWFTGLLIGLEASGFVTAASYLGGKK